MSRSRKQDLAGRELRRRREGEVYRDPPHRPMTRPFSHATDQSLRRIAANPDPQLQRQFEQQEDRRKQLSGKTPGN